MRHTHGGRIVGRENITFVQKYFMLLYTTDETLVHFMDIDEQPVGSIQQTNTSRNQWFILRIRIRPPPISQPLFGLKKVRLSLAQLSWSS
jgi:hypothetical protein